MCNIVRSSRKSHQKKIAVYRPTVTALRNVQQVQNNKYLSKEKKKSSNCDFERKQLITTAGHLLTRRPRRFENLPVSVYRGNADF